MNQSRFARRLRRSRPAPQSGPSEPDQHPMRPSFRTRIINLFRPRSARENRARDSQTGCNPVVEDTRPHCAPPAVQVDPWPYRETFHSTRHSTHDNNIPNIVITESGGEPSSPDFPPDILCAPRLPPLSLPWTGPSAWMAFKRLELTCPINTDDCLLILRDCTSLTEFKLTLVEGNSLPVVPPRVQARNLCSLAINSSCGTGRLFRSLRLPQLNSVHLSLELLAEPPTDIGLRSLIVRSDCSIMTLSLTNVFSLERELTACLRVVSKSLINLVVRNDTGYIGKISRGTLSRLVVGGEASQPCCPNLQSLELSPCVARDGLLAKMVASRLPDEQFKFTYSFLDPSLHRYDTEYLATHLNALHRIHQLY
jgi:hypothetical protein